MARCGKDGDGEGWGREQEQERRDEWNAGQATSHNHARTVVLDWRSRVRYSTRYVRHWGIGGASRGPAAAGSVSSESGAAGRNVAGTLEVRKTHEEVVLATGFECCTERTNRYSMLAGKQLTSTPVLRRLDPNPCRPPRRLETQARAVRVQARHVGRALQQNRRRASRGRPHGDRASVPSVDPRKVPVSLFLLSFEFRDTLLRLAVEADPPVCALCRQGQDIEAVAIPAKPKKKVRHPPFYSLIILRAIYLSSPRIAVPWMGTQGPVWEAYPRMRVGGGRRCNKALIDVRLVRGGLSLLQPFISASPPSQTSSHLDLTPSRVICPCGSEVAHHRSRS